MTNHIRRAIEILARTGWTKNTFTDEEGRHCLQGALYDAYGVCPSRVTGELAADVRLVNETIEEQYPERYGAVGISRFNDHADTTIADVVRVLEKAAVRKDELLG